MAASPSGSQDGEIETLRAMQRHRDNGRGFQAVAAAPQVFVDSCYSEGFIDDL